MASPPKDSRVGLAKLLRFSIRTLLPNVTICAHLCQSVSFPPHRRKPYNVFLVVKLEVVSHDSFILYNYVSAFVFLDVNRRLMDEHIYKAQRVSFKGCEMDRSSSD